MGRKKDPLEGAEEQGTTLEAYVIQQKVKAWTDYYVPADELTATEKYGEVKLRQFFKAYPCSLGDPLTIYLDRLEQAGYSMKVDIGQGEPVIYVSERYLKELSAPDQM